MNSQSFLSNLPREVFQIHLTSDLTSQATLFGVSKIGWCVGRNPPFVDCGIWLIGLPALSGGDLISVCLPFPLAGRPFHRSIPAHSTLHMFHCQVRVDVSFLLRCQGSRLPHKRCNSTRGRSFLRPIFLGPKATHQLASPGY
jgi:hypothetical protein